MIRYPGIPRDRNRRYVHALLQCGDAPRQAFSKPLTTDTYHGKLFVVDRHSRMIHGFKHYLCHCRCGHELLLQAYEIRAREKLNEGCAASHCHCTTLEGKRWLNIELSLSHQWAYYLYTNPFDVDQNWSGCMLPSAPIRSEEAGLRAFLAYARRLVNHRKGKIWLCKKRQSAPFQAGNLYATTSRPSRLFAMPWDYMFDGSEYRTHRAIATHLQLPPSLIMEVRVRHLLSFPAYLELTTQN